MISLEPTIMNDYKERQDVEDVETPICGNSRCGGGKWACHTMVPRSFTKDALSACLFLEAQVCAL